MTNDAGGRIAGIAVSGTAGRFVNSGTISGPSYYSYSYNNFSSANVANEITMASGGSVVNGASGSICGVSISGGGASLDNQGTITGASYLYQHFRGTKEQVSKCLSRKMLSRLNGL